MVKLRTRPALRPDGTSGQCKCKFPSWFSDGALVVSAMRCNKCGGWQDPVAGERTQVAGRIFSGLSGELDHETLMRIAAIATTVTPEEKYQD